MEIGKDYYYGKQTRTYIRQFAQVFSELFVTVGKNDLNTTNSFVRVPIIYGTGDRVVSAIKSDNTQNKMPKLPILAIKLLDISLNLDRKHGTNTESRRTVFPRGGDIANDVKTVYRLTPLPYKLEFGIWSLASNSDQQLQIMEQIIMLFDPLLQLQTSDSILDWTKIIDAELTSVQLDNNRDDEGDGRILLSSYKFAVNCYYSPPANIKDDVIKKIRLRISAVDKDENLTELMADVDRPTPEYVEIINVTTMDLPPN